MVAGVLILAFRVGMDPLSLLTPNEPATVCAGQSLRLDHLEQVKLHGRDIPIAAGMAGDNPLGLRALLPKLFERVVECLGGATILSQLVVRCVERGVDDRDETGIHILTIMHSDTIGEEGMVVLSLDVPYFLYTGVFNVIDSRGDKVPVAWRIRDRVTMRLCLIRLHSGLAQATMQFFPLHF